MSFNYYRVKLRSFLHPREGKLTKKKFSIENSQLYIFWLLKCVETDFQLMNKKCQICLFFKFLMTIKSDRKKLVVKVS